MNRPHEETPRAAGAAAAIPPLAHDFSAPYTGRAIDALSAPFFVVDRDRRVVDANPAARAFFAAPSPCAARAGSCCHAVVHGEAAPPAACPLERLLATGERAVARMAFAGREYEVTLDPLYEAGRVVGAAHLARAVPADAGAIPPPLGEIAGGVAHEFNNILTTILGNAELGLLEAAPDAPLRRNLKEISAAAHRASAVCREMILCAGGGRFVKRRVEVAAFLRDLAPALRAAAPAGVTVRDEIPAALPAAEVDAGRLRDAITNLAVNAFEAFGGRPGAVTLRAGRRRFTGAEIARAGIARDSAGEEFIYIEVSDDGPGMPPGVLARAFHPFFSTRFFGRGLGLPAALGIAVRHGGGLLLESAEGSGTTACILIPAGRASAAAAGHAPAASARKRGTLLFADDEEAVRRFTAEYLEIRGFEVHLARDGREALEILRALGDRLDAALLDVAMPAVDGISVMREIRRLHPATKVILATGLAPAELERRLDAGPPDAWVDKPYRLQTLDAALAAALG